MGELVIVWVLVGIAGFFLLRRLARAITGRAGEADTCAGCVHGRDCGRMPQSREKVAACSDFRGIREQVKGKKQAGNKGRFPSIPKRRDPAGGVS